MVVDALNLAAPDGVEYAFIDNPFIGDDTNGGEGGGNIRVAFVYRTDRVDFVEGSLRTMAADGTAISDPAGNTDQHTNADNPFFTSRPPLAATFEFNGEEVTVVNNHWTSKGGSGALYGSDESPINQGEVQRAAQAQAVNSFVDGILANDADARVVVTGDFNDFPFEQPLAVLRGEATLTNYDGTGAPTATYHAGRHGGAARPGGDAAGGRAVRLRVRRQWADARPLPGERAACRTARSSTSFASMPSSPIRPATTNP